MISDETKVLVATGTPWNEGRTTEIIDLVDPTFGCTLDNQFPIRLAGATGGFIDEKPMICGGLSLVNSTHGSISKACYTLEGNGVWMEDQSAAISSARYYAATGSTILNNKLVLAGGKAGPLRLQTIDLTSPNSFTRSETLSVQLPVGLYFSCIVPWDTNSFMVIGGCTTSCSRKETYFVFMGNGTVASGPELINGRDKHACEEIIVNDQSYIAAVGGHDSDSEFAFELLPKHAFKSGWVKSKH